MSILLDEAQGQRVERSFSVEVAAVASQGQHRLVMSHKRLRDRPSNQERLRDLMRPWGYKALQPLSEASSWASGVCLACRRPGLTADLTRGTSIDVLSPFSGSTLPALQRKWMARPASRGKQSSFQGRAIHFHACWMEGTWERFMASG